MSSALSKFPIIVSNSSVHGQGVFATRTISKGEVIERCPYIVIDDDDLAEINRLQDYLFTSPDQPGDYLCVLGYGMMYNHSDKPNAEWEIDEDDIQFVRFTALKPIADGEEIFQNYGVLRAPTFQLILFCHIYYLFLCNLLINTQLYQLIYFFL